MPYKGDEKLLFASIQRTLQRLEILKQEKDSIERDFVDERKERGPIGPDRVHKLMEHANGSNRLLRDLLDQQLESLGRLKVSLHGWLDRKNLAEEDFKGLVKQMVGQTGLKYRMDLVLEWD